MSVIPTSAPELCDLDNLLYLLETVYQMDIELNELAESANS